MKTSSLLKRCGPCRERRAFTLLELLVVVALVAGLATFLIGGLGGAGKPAALQLAQATVANLIAAARAHAMATGHGARVLVHISPASPLARERFLRCLALQTYDGAEWRTLAEVSLPAGVFFVPRDPLSVVGLLPPEKAWTRPSDGATLRSTALRANTSSFPDAEVSAMVNAEVAERWAAIKFSATGTTANAGDLVLALGNGGDGVTESPIRLDTPERVRGVTISAYGATAMVNDRASF